MVALSQEARPLVERVASRVRERTYGRIRELVVEVNQDEVILHGRVPTHHVRQLALQGALEMLSGERCRPLITVG